MLLYLCVYLHEMFFTLNKATMARIRSNSVTPKIKGDDARKFRTDLLKSLRKSLNPNVRKEKQKELEEMEKDYKFFASISRGAF